jgi:hypothetical protein
MEKLILFTKTYSGDFERVKVLLESIKKHNKDNLPFYISIEKKDYELFNQLEGLTILFDEDITETIFRNININWHYQQIIKASLWKLGITENWVCIDSDSYFIKDFYLHDFMYDENTPYTVMHENKDLLIFETSKFNNLPFDFRESFRTDRMAIKSVFGRGGRVYDFGPTPSIWNEEVWRTLEDEYLKPNNLTFDNLITNTPSEFTWYGEWLLYRRNFELWPIEPMFKVFHYKQQYDEWKHLGYEEKDFSKDYLGIVMQSNWGAPLKY